MGRRRASLVALALTLLAGYPAPSSGAEPAADLTVSVAPERIKAPDDFSSTYRGYWWDFADPTHYASELSRNGWTNPRLEGGWWKGTSAASTGSPSQATGMVRLSHLNVDGPWTTAPKPTNWEPAEHRYRPFDPAYRFLTVRMCADGASHTVVRWQRNASLPDGDYGGTNYQDVLPGCRIYLFDLVADRNPRVGTLGWGQAPLYGLTLLPVIDPGIEVAIDYATLSTSPQGQAVAITWSPASTPVSLLFSTSPDGADATGIVEGAAGGSYRWQTPDLAPGRYYLIAQAADGGRHLGGSLVVDSPPRGRITKPSFTSGPDYATQVVGNAWDMAGPVDIEYTRSVVDASFAGGIYRATSAAARPTGDMGLFLHVTSPIDPDKYRYLTYRMWVEGEGTLEGTGGVARVVWYNDPRRLPGTWTTTRPVRVYAGWRTVTIDLATAYLEPVSYIGPWGRYPVTDLRLDPHESPAPRAVALDWVTLTGDERADRAFRIRYTASDPDGGTPRAEFYYDTDRDPAGSKPLACAADPQAPRGLSCRWVTANLPDGDYFVHLLLTDAAGNRTWTTSDIPLLVRH